MTDYLHITNGDSTRLGLDGSGVPGDVFSYGDILHEGPVPTGLPAGALGRLRAAWIADALDRDPAAVAAQAGREDAAFDRWRQAHEVVFWFEHDLYDQLLLIHHLDRLSTDRRAGHGRGTRCSLVCGDVYLGPLEPAAFPPLFAARRPISEDQLAEGTAAWRAFTDPEPHALAIAASSSSASLPYLAPALQRFLEDYPSTRDGLARSERQILRALADGASEPDALFRAAAAQDQWIWMGDTVFWLWVRRLAAAPRPLVSIDVVAGTGGLPRGTVLLSPAGADVLAGRADGLSGRAIDRWMGGVHLTPERCWRWDGARLLAS